MKAAHESRDEEVNLIRSILQIADTLKDFMLVLAVSQWWESK